MKYKIGDHVLCNINYFNDLPFGSSGEILKCVQDTENGCHEIVYRVQWEYRSSCDINEEHLDLDMNFKKYNNLRGLYEND